MSFGPPEKTGTLPLPACLEPGPSELSTGVTSVTLDTEKMTRPGTVNEKLSCDLPPCMPHRLEGAGTAVLQADFTRCASGYTGHKLLCHWCRHSKQFSTAPPRGHEGLPVEA